MLYLPCYGSRYHAVSYKAMHLGHRTVMVGRVWQPHTKTSPDTSFFNFVYLQALDTLDFSFETFAGVLNRVLVSNEPF